MAHVIGSGVRGAAFERDIFVGFESAKEFWRNDSNLGYYADCLDPDGQMVFADRFDLSSAITREAELADRGIGLYSERPLDLLAPVGAKTDSDLVNLHWVRCRLPKHSFVQGRDGVLVCSPELLFLQAAGSYSLVELLKLGMELCGTYAMDCYEPLGFASRRKICTAGRIKRYLAWFKKVPGLQRARLAASMLMDDSNSPLETKAMLALTLPPRYGGIGLRRPVLNDCRSTTELQAETIGDHSYYYDARWSGKLRSGQRYSVDCEVDSNAFHFDRSADAKADVIRKDNVQFMNSLHISISSDELGDADLLMKKGLMIAKHIGQRIRRYPRRGTPEQKAAFEEGWSERLKRLGELLRELGSDAHPPRPCPAELKVLKKSARKGLGANGEVKSVGQPPKND